MAKRGRSTGSLGQLERQLADLNARRQRVIAQIKATLERLSYGSSAVGGRPSGLAKPRREAKTRLG